MWGVWGGNTPFQSRGGARPDIWDGGRRWLIAEHTRLPTTSGRYAGYDNGWAISVLAPVILEFDKSIVDFPNIKRFPGGASNDMNPNLQNPANPLPLMDIKKVVRTIGMGD
jgi:hypothetical protein